MKYGCSWTTRSLWVCKRARDPKWNAVYNILTLTESTILRLWYAKESTGEHRPKGHFHVIFFFFLYKNFHFFSDGKLIFFISNNKYTEKKQQRIHIISSIVDTIKEIWETWTILISNEWYSTYSFGFFFIVCNFWWQYV